MTFLELAEEVLKRVNLPLTGNQIWEQAVAFGLEKQLKKYGKTPSYTMGSRLYVDVKDNPKSKFEPFGKRPVRFGLKGMKVKASEIEGPEETQKTKFGERDLHPLLVKFAQIHPHFRGAKLKTIFHETSKKRKKGYNEWIHPDLVGIYFSFDDKINKYEKVILDFQNDFSIISSKLFSFEVKIRVKMSDLREYYFQAVSNSSWANEGYLVALHFEEDVIEEAGRLANSFGIGLIKLDSENIEESQIIIPGALRRELDIDAMDRLAGENPDFSNFLQDIIHDKKDMKVRGTYDKVLDDEAFEKYVKDKGIV